MTKSLKILFAPLDWGLGHATRCIPLIRECLQLGHEVVLAASGQIKSLLHLEFPELEVLELFGYEVKYSNTGWKLLFKMAGQTPRLLLKIKQEKTWLEQQIRIHRIDLVISDNRYGLSSTNIPCLLICHQLQIKVPQSSLLESLVNRLNHRLIMSFNTCLVPDYHPPGMGGDLSVSRKLPNLRYLGNLSRFAEDKGKQASHDLLVLLSGPEPQRSILEKEILIQLKETTLRVLVVRGKPGHSSTRKKSGNIEIVSHLPTSGLQTAIQSAEIIISRAGYTTIMDLIKLNKRAILIPTPGQTEQEYLGEYLRSMKWFFTYKQSGLNLKNLLTDYHQYEFAPFPNWDLNLYKKEFSEVLDKYSQLK